MKKILSVLFYTIFACYIVLMLLVFFRLNSIPYIDILGKRSVNLIPFYTIAEFLSGTGSVSTALNNILGNVIVFVPYGLYVQVIRKDKRFGLSFLQMAITSVMIEIIQFIFNLGAADIDDVILNCLGGLIGIALYKLLIKMVKEEDKAKNVITILSLVVGLPIIIIACILVFYNRVSIYHRA